MKKLQYIQPEVKAEIMMMETAVLLLGSSTGVEPGISSSAPMRNGGKRAVF